MQFVFDDDGTCRRIVYRIGEQDDFDVFSYEMLRENAVPGLLTPMRAESNGMDAVQYDVSNLDTLRDYLTVSLSVRQLLSVFSQIISAAQALDDYLLDNSPLVTDMEHIYCDREHHEVKMIYYLLSGEPCRWRLEEKLFRLFREIIFSARFAVGDGDRYIAELLNSINDAKNFSLGDFKEVVLRLDGLVSGGSRSADEERGICLAVSDNAVRYGVPESRGDMYYTEQDSDAIAREEDADTADREETGIRRFIRKLLAKTGSDRHVRDGEAECVMENFSDNEVLCEEEQPDIGDGETVVLFGGSMGAHTPYLIRSSNRERIAINKKVFKIGKDGRYADYIISDNAAVSRAHAEFLIKDGKIYVTDADSLNSTYINGGALVSGREYEVDEGDVIAFADEEFVLHC